jgi:hypothetical protein
MSYCEFKNCLELAYFASGPVVAIGVIIALKQYWKFAKDIDDKYSREIGRQAIEDITTFNRVIVPKYVIYDQEAKSKGMLPFAYNGNIADVENTNLIESSKSFSENISEKAKQEATELIIELNRLSLSFQFGISDERKIYEIIGNRFAEIFQSVSFMAVLIHQNKGANLAALFDTYNKWKNWMDLEKAKLDLSAKTKAVAALEVMAKEPIKPIGM